MLLKSHISNIVIHSDEWFAGRLAKFTSSEYHFLMAAEGIGKTALKYIWRKVGERSTGTPCRQEISTPSTDHGHEYEPENLLYFGREMGIEFLVTQKLITSPLPGTMEGSTPDAMWVLKESVDQLSYNVFTVEAKCPTAYDRHIELYNCTTPEHIKKVEPKYYWQVLHQMRACDALRGYLSIYNPFFRVGGLNIIEFKKIDLVPEFTLMEQRFKLACEIFDEQYNKMLQGKQFKF